MTQNDKKRAAALAALDELKPGKVVGIGTGSTTNHFIEALAERRELVAGAVASSESSAERLRSAGIRLVDLNDVEALPVYVDGADEAVLSKRPGDLAPEGFAALAALALERGVAE